MSAKRVVTPATTDRPPALPEAVRTSSGGCSAVRHWQVFGLASILA
jgi:hypothetical protein